MKRMGIVGLCLIAALAMSAIAVSSASATPPEFGRCKGPEAGGKFSDAGCIKKVSTGGKFNWVPGAGPLNHVQSVMTSSLATLEGEGGIQISCTSQKLAGKGFEVVGTKEAKGIIAEYHGCKSGTFACEDEAGHGLENITTAVLEAHIGFSTSSTAKVDSSINGPGGTGDLADFHCSTVLKVEVHGSIMHEQTVNKMLLKSVEKFSAVKGEQAITKFKGEACAKKNPVKSKDKAGEPSGECDNHQLASKLKVEFTEPEESGQSQTNENTGEEALEINTKF